MTSVIRSRLPDESHLKTELHSVLESNLPDFLKSTRVRRDEIRGNRRFVLLSVFFALAVLFGLYLVYETFSGVLANVLIAGILAWSTIIILTGRQWLTNDQLLAREMNMALVPMLTNTFDRMLMYTHSDTGREDTLAQLRESSLVADTAAIDIVSDDVYTVFGKPDTVIRELVISAKSQYRWVPPTVVFSGLFVSVSLPQPHSGEVYISTQGGGGMFSHREFWSHVLQNERVSSQTSVDSALEEPIFVAKSADAQSVSVDLLHDVYQWWNGRKKLNLRLAIKDNVLYILLPEASVKIATSTTSTKSSAIEKYVWGLALPIWHSLRMVESVTTQGQSQDR